MDTTTEPLGTLWVCTDCLMADANSEEPLEDTGYEPWSKLELATQFHTTMGMPSSMHDDGCPAFDENEETTGNECYGCETQTFSWSCCDGCGSHLGGSRHAYTLWSK